MSQDPLGLAKDVVTRWSTYVSHLNDPGWDGEELAEFIDIVDLLPDEFDEAEEGIRSSLILIQGLNGLWGRGLDEVDHQITLDAMSAGLSRLGEKVGIPVPEDRPH